MKKMIVGLLMLACSAVHAVDEKVSTSFKTQITPFFYGDFFAPGYGVSLRVQKWGHTAEFAPLFSPSIDLPPNHEGYRDKEKTIGFVSSYSYSFRQTKAVQPYIGYAFTYFRDLHRHETCESYHEETDFRPLVGVQYCKLENNVSLHVFVDALGPFGQIYTLTLKRQVAPRFGIGCSF